MSTLSREFRSRIRGRVTRFTTEDPERGAISLEQVIWASIIGAAAVIAAGAIVAIIVTFTSQIPTG
ncbi:hypothetical protein ACPW96_18295 [Micromonospora sp. DT81.3]|uniref:hypothetical protein n=1 Tax=Micromonospora sp. DT81.3 TaxID=3416523 RepID=UPI003CE85DFA